ncbi:MAG: LacI family transcriptional regulator [Rhodobacteraceae bacterium]|jgi:LacI family transcriptional regulator|nr:LacI family transcriptional regulator [Paracoccaceae bacterium]
MTRKVTIRDVARRAGVSVGTASRVINGSGNVAAELRQSVERTIIEIGFQPNSAAQSIRSGTSRTIGLLVSDIRTLRLAHLVRGAQTELERAGYGVFIACHENDREREAQALQFLSRRRIDGLIHSNCNDRETEGDATAPGMAVPTVVYDRDGPEHADLVQIAHDAGIRQAVEYLAGLGHRRIGLITGPGFMYPARSRIEGLRAALSDAGLPFEPRNVSATSFGEAFVDVSNMITRPDRPSAIILGGASMLGGALRAIRAQRLEIPRDLSLVAAGDSELAQLATPAITVVRWDMEEIGRACATALLSRIKTPDAPRRRLLVDPELVVRGSCAALAANLRAAAAE